MIDDLKPCPFCGGDTVRKWKGGEEYWYGCEDCDLGGPSGETEYDAVLAWNNRPVEDALCARIVELEAQLAEYADEPTTAMWLDQNERAVSLAEALAAERDALNAQLADVLRPVTQWVAEAHRVMLHNEDALRHGGELLALPEPPSLPEVRP